MSVYNDKGFDSREKYLDNLAEAYGVDRETVFALADLLGESEDFDGLVSAVDELSDASL